MHSTSPIGASAYIQPIDYNAVTPPLQSPYATAYSYTAPSTTGVYGEPIQAYVPVYNNYASTSPYTTSSWTSGQADNAWGTPINTSEQEPIYDMYISLVLSNLQYSMSKQDLEQLVDDYGCQGYSDIKFKVNHQGQCSGTAIITYSTLDDALSAVEILDQVVWGGRPIKARMDKNLAAITASGPPVVNGSTM
jgi:RNA recognition motif-containing protein